MPRHNIFNVNLYKSVSILLMFWTILTVPTYADVAVTVPTKISLNEEEFIQADLWAVMLTPERTDEKAPLLRIQCNGAGGTRVVVLFETDALTEWSADPVRANTHYYKVGLDIEYNNSQLELFNVVFSEWNNKYSALRFTAEDGGKIIKDLEKSLDKGKMVFRWTAIGFNSDKVLVPVLEKTGYTFMNSDKKRDAAQEVLRLSCM